MRCHWSNDNDKQRMSTPAILPPHPLLDRLQLRLELPVSFSRSLLQVSQLACEVVLLLFNFPVAGGVGQLRRSGPLLRSAASDKTIGKKAGVGG